MKRIHQKELARRLGVSQSAVSAVLNNNTSIRVGEATREKILAAIKDYNYTPNLLANALFDRDTKTVGIIYQGGYVQLGIKKLSEVICRVVERGHIPIVYDLLHNVKGIEQCGLLCDLKVKGVVLINASHTFVHEVYPHHLEGRLPVVSIDSPWRPNIRKIYSDRVQGFRILTEHLLKMGYRKIGILLNQPHPMDTDSPYSHTYGMQYGVKAALDKAGLQIVWAEMFDSSKTPPQERSDPYWGGAIAMRRLLDQGRDVDAVICANDSWAVGAMHECARRGIRVPEDLAVVGFNNEVQARYAMRALTTVAPPVEEMARVAVESIIATDPAVQPDTEQPLLMPCELVVRESCGTVITKI